MSDLFQHRPLCKSGSNPSGALAKMVRDIGGFLFVVALAVFLLLPALPAHAGLTVPEDVEIVKPQRAAPPKMPEVSRASEDQILVHKANSFVAETGAVKNDESTAITQDSGQDYPPSAGLVYQRYYNSRFGYEIDFPSPILKALPEADNGDGRHFDSNDGEIRLSCWGSLKHDTSIDDDYKRVLQEIGAGCTYKSRKANWFVVSGLKEGKVWYKRTIELENEFVTFEITYPHELLEYMNPVVSRISKSFKVQDK